MDSRAYWKMRERENLRRNKKVEKEYEKQINDMFDRLLADIDQQINAFYARYAKAENISMAEAKKRIAEADIAAYERKAKKYVKDKVFTAEANAEMRLFNALMRINRLEYLKAQIGMEMCKTFSEYQRFMEEILGGRTEEEIKRMAGILGEGVSAKKSVVDSIVFGSFYNAKWSDRIWANQAQLKAEIAKLLENGFIQGKNPRALISELRKLFGVSKYEALRLMVTEMARVQTESQKRSFEENGYEEYTFIAEPTACPICRALDGKHFKVKKMVYGSNAPPIHPNCRCSTSAYMDRKKFEEWLDSIPKGEVEYAK